MKKNKIKVSMILLSIAIITFGIVLYVLVSNRDERHSVYQEEMMTYLTDNEDILELIQGPAGIDGIDGINGIDGEDGIDGVDGIDGEDGIDGVDGVDGVNGTDGVDGINGTNGVDGVDGAVGTVTTETVTDITGILKGSGTNVETAIADVDYLTPGTAASTYLKLDSSNGLITGDLLIKTTTNSTSAFSIQNSDGNVLLNIDTTNQKVELGSLTSLVELNLLGTAKFGSTATDYSEFEADGTMKMNGDATVWEDLRVQILTRTSSRVSPTFTAGFGGNSEIYTYEFDPDTDNNVYFEAQMPHTWASTKIYPHVHWAPADTATGTVRWILECTWSDYQSTFGTSFTYIMDSTISEASQYKHMIADSGTGLTPTTDQDSVSTMLICRLYRDGAAAEDTYTGEASLIAFDIHYEMDTLGSRTMYGK